LSERTTYVECTVEKAEQLPPLEDMPKPIDPEQTPVLEVDELRVFFWLSWI